MGLVKLGILALLACAPAMAATITYDFNDGTLDGLALNFQSAGYSYVVSGGVLDITAAAGTGHGPNGDGISLISPLIVAGDFTATVNATRTSLTSDGIMGFIMVQSDGSYIEVAENGPDNVFVDKTVGSGFTASDSTLDESLRITRSGAIITTSFSSDGGNTYQTLGSVTPRTFFPFLPVRFGIIMSRANLSTAAQSGDFDNLSITSDSIAAPLPPVGIGGLVLLGGVGVIRLARRARRSV